ncbi:uncharacterized protein METZ01_LOCUS185456 [marine metagenome]|uniref:Uncharacterized protein n=1 Tax=marine metagenome TaxID=408172 RepID=A0A382D3K6_9ZZZZ
MANFYGSYIGYGGGGGTSAELFQGEFFGYCNGGQQAGNQAYDRIDRFAFPPGANSSDVGNLATISMYNCSQTDGLSGFLATANAAYPVNTGIQRYSYASATEDAVAHGNLSQGRGSVQGVSGIGTGYGYVCGGASPHTALKEKFAFASNVTASGAGNLSIARHQGGGVNDLTHGYNLSGYNSNESADYTRIDRFAFASDGDSVNCGDVTVSRGGCDNGSCSDIHGYLAGGYGIGEGYTNVIDKHTFASTVSASDVGDLSATNQGNGANSSTDYGYAFGGQPPATLDTIWKWSYASGTQNGPDTGYNLSLARVYVSGSQH